MFSTLPKLSFLTAVILSLTACSSAILDGNATTKIQKQSTANDQKHLIPVHLVSADGVGASIGTVSFQETPKGLLQHL